MLAIASAIRLPSGIAIKYRAAPPSGEVPAFWVIIDLRHAKFAALFLGLHHDIDEHFEQRANIAARQIGAAFAFLDQQGQLLERQFGRVCMDGRDRAGMARVHVAQIEEGRPVAQFLEQDAVGPHPERAFEQMLGRDIRGALAVLGIEHVDDILVRDDQFARVLDCQQPFFGRDELDQSL